MHVFFCIPDIDECSANNCHKEATCQNAPGYYMCMCKNGFQGDGVNVCEGESYILIRRPHATPTHKYISLLS